MKATDRKKLQKHGERLDRETQGAWIVNGFVRDEMAADPATDFVVDAVRTKDQIDRFRSAYGARVIHVHLTAPPEELAKRWERRRDARAAEHDEPATYADVAKDATERRVEGLPPWRSDLPRGDTGDGAQPAPRGLSACDFARHHRERMSGRGGHPAEPGATHHHGLQDVPDPRAESGRWDVWRHVAGDRVGGRLSAVGHPG